MLRDRFSSVLRRPLQVLTGTTAAAMLAGVTTAVPAAAVSPTALCFETNHAHHCLDVLELHEDYKDLVPHDIVGPIDPHGPEDTTVLQVADGLQQLVQAEATADPGLAATLRRGGWATLDAAAPKLRDGLPVGRVARVDGSPADRDVAGAASSFADALGDLTDVRRRPTAVDRIEAAVETLARHLG